MDLASLNELATTGGGVMVILAYMIFYNRRDRKKPNGGTSRADLAAKLEKIDDEVCELGQRVARIEGHLDAEHYG